MGKERTGGGVFDRLFSSVLGPREKWRRRKLRVSGKSLVGFLRRIRRGRELAALRRGFFALTILCSICMVLTIIALFLLLFAKH